MASERWGQRARKMGVYCIYTTYYEFVKKKHFGGHKHTYININKIYLSLNIHLYISISTLEKVITFRL